MGKKATIYDVARHASVSISTVSRVLNSPSKVNKETREAVLRAIEVLEFVPRAEAIARAQKHLRRVGVLAPYFAEASFVQRIRGISSSLSPWNTELIVYTVMDEKQLDEYLDVLPLGKRVDGLVILSLGLNDRQLERLRSSSVPAVFVEQDTPGFSSVTIDNDKGGAMGADFLIARGYRRLGFIGETSPRPFSLEVTEKRLEGFRRSVRKAGLEMSEDMVKVCEVGDTALFDWLDALLDSERQPDALMCSSDLLAAKTIQRASSRGIAVPERLAVLGFDDSDLAGYLDLSTVRQGLDYSGVLAGEMIRKLITDESSGGMHTVYLDLTIIERGTC